MTKLKDFTPFALPAPRWYLPLGVLLQVIAVSVSALGFYYIAFLIEPRHIDDSLIRALLVLAAIVFAFIFVMANRLQINTREKLLDDRAPILYFRPFCHEHSKISYEPNEVFSYSHKDNPLSPALKLLSNMVWPGAWHDDSVSATDGEIARALNEIGPVVAVGLPDETLPPAGALRLYFKDEEWQGKVKALMSISRMVIIQPGYSPNLEWEMDTARQYFQPDQIYISFLDWADLKKESRELQFEIFNLQLRRIYGISLPEHFINARLIYFDNDWKPLKVTLDWRGKVALLPTFSSSSTSALRWMLRPVLQKRGMKLSLWRTLIYELGSKSLYGIIFFGYVYLCFRFGN